MKRGAGQTGSLFGIGISMSDSQAAGNQMSALPGPPCPVKAHQKQVLIHGPDQAKSGLVGKMGG